MNYKKVFFVAGHSKSDPGAVATDGTTERSVVEGICDKLMDVVDVLSEEKIVFQFIGLSDSLTVTEKTNKINGICKKEGLDYTNSLLISLHADWRGASEGVSGYFYGGSNDSANFLEDVSIAVAKNTERTVKWMKPDTSSRFGRLGIVRDTDPLACLLETGTLKSDSDKTDGLELLTSPDGQLKIAQAIIEGIEDFIGEKIELEDPMPEPPANTFTETVFNSMMWVRVEDARSIKSPMAKDEVLKDMQRQLHERNEYLKANSSK